MVLEIVLFIMIAAMPKAIKISIMFIVQKPKMKESNSLLVCAATHPRAAVIIKNAPHITSVRKT